MNTQANTTIQVDKPAIMQAIANKEWRTLTREFLKSLEGFRKAPITDTTPQNEEGVHHFLQLFFHAMMIEEYGLQNDEVFKLILCNPTIAHLAAISKFGSTDLILKKLLEQKNNFSKLLILYSPRNTVKISFDTLFKTNNVLAFHWWCNVIGYYSPHTKAHYEFLKELATYPKLKDAAKLHPDFWTTHSYSAPYFSLSYLGDDIDKKIKPFLNSAYANAFPAHNSPDMGKRDKKSITVISSMMYKKHAVFRSQAPMLRALKGAYELSLLTSNKVDKSDIDYDLFDRVYQYDNAEDSPTLDARIIDWIKALNPCLIYYTDIGMDYLTTLLAQIKLAPIQVTGYGHPVSTFGETIDYFVVDRDFEDMKTMSRYYSENLIVVPGAAVPIVDKHARTNPQKPESPVVIALNWSHHKSFYPFMEQIRTVLQKTKKKVTLRVMAVYWQEARFVPFARDVKAFFESDNVSVETYPMATKEEYARYLEPCHFAIDSHPFGGFNRIMDALYLGVPVMARMGERVFSRIAGVSLQRVGLGELVAETDGAFPDILTRLIEDADFRASQAKKLEGIDLEKLLTPPGAADAFRKGIDYVIQNYEGLKDKPENVIMAEALP